jgi:hypothetical protein
VELAGLLVPEAAYVRFELIPGNLDFQESFEPEDDIQEVWTDPLHPPQVRQLVPRVDRHGRYPYRIRDCLAHCQPKPLRAGFRTHGLDVVGVGQWRALALHATPLLAVPTTLATHFLDAPKQEVKRHEQQFQKPE